MNPDLDIKLDRIARPNRVMAPIRYFGGKGIIAPRILPYLPDGRIYVEPFCGAASLFWHQRPHPVEVLNDLDGEVINLFRVLQDEDLFLKFRHKVIWTPYSLDEFRRAIAYRGDDPLMWAWAMYVAHNQGFGGIIGETEGAWGRAFVSSRGMAYTASIWRGRMRSLDSFHDRLTRVQLDNRDALQVIRYWDSPETVFYLDPPYTSGSRMNKAVYRHEMTDEQHRALVEVLLRIEGSAMLSGYADAIYEPLNEAGWDRIEIETVCHAAGKVRGSGLQGADSALKKVPRTEVLWIKKNANQQQKGLFTS